MSEWTKTTVKGVNQRKSKSIKPEDFPNEYFESYSVPTFPSSKPEIVTGDSIKSTKQVVQTGDVLLCKINPRINRVWQVSNFSKHRKIASSEWIVVRPSKDINPSFLRYQWSAPHFRKLMCTDVSGVGGSLTRARPKIVNEYPTYLPDPTTQEKIVTHLDSFFTRHAILHSAVARLPGMLADFRAAVLHRAVTGAITAEWREDKLKQHTISWYHDMLQHLLEQNGISRYQKQCLQEALNSEVGHNENFPRAWIATSINKVGIIKLGGTPSRNEPKYWNGQIPWVSSGEVKNDEITTTGESITTLGLENSNAKLLPKNSVLIAMIGEGKTRGQSSILRIAATTNQNVAAVVTPEQFVLPKYVWYNFLARYDQNRRDARGGNQPALNGKKVGELPIALPPIEEQHEIVRRVDQLFTFAERIEQRIVGLEKAIEDLPSTVLAKVFEVQE